MKQKITKEPVRESDMLSEKKPSTIQILDGRTDVTIRVT